MLSPNPLKILVCLLLLGLTYSSRGQSLDTTDRGDSGESWRYGVVISDLLAPRVTFSLNYRLNETHGMGLHLGVPWDPKSGDGDKYYSSVHQGLLARLWHRVYVPQSSDPSSPQFLAKHGPGVNWGRLGYLRTRWFPDRLNGDPVKVYEERELDDEVIKGHYTAMAGFIVGTDNWIQMELMLGAQYAFFLQESQAGLSPKPESLPIVNEWLYEGIRPFVQVTLNIVP